MRARPADPAFADPRSATVRREIGLGKALLHHDLGVTVEVR